MTCHVCHEWHQSIATSCKHLLKKAFPWLPVTRGNQYRAVQVDVADTSLIQVITLLLTLPAYVQPSFSTV